MATLRKLGERIKAAIGGSRVRPSEKWERGRGCYQGAHSFTVVSAAYNVAPYLDDFFRSLDNQTIAPDRLSIVMVDDGSTDDTAQRIEEWAMKMPGRVTLLRKANGGSGSARNLGLANATSGWVAFIDPDDFVSPDYFELLDRELCSHVEAKLLVANQLFYYESSDKVSNSHPLKWRFRESRYYSYDDERLPPVFSMSTALFDIEEIRRLGLAVDEGIRPNFEDGLFANEYLLGLRGGEIGFLSQPLYYYRKRDKGNSQIDTCWDSPSKFLILPEHAYLRLLCEAQERRGYLPWNIKQTVLYDLGWYYKTYVDHPERIPVLSSEQKDHALDVLKTIYTMIGADALFSSDNRKMGFDHKAAVCKFFLNQAPPFQKVYLRGIGEDGVSLEFQTFLALPEVYLDGSLVSGFETESRSRTFLDREMYTSHEFVLRPSGDAAVIQFIFPDIGKVVIDVLGEGYSNGATVGELVGAFRARKTR